MFLCIIGFLLMKALPTNAFQENKKNKFIICSFLLGY
nr:MAG TPA: hypothetical protein [Caudoviricetes sp.]